MPRKKSRKSVLEKKPKLEFVTSPVLGPECPISPVMGALHPLTAKARAVDESNLTWISPNFQELARRGLSMSRLKLMRGKATVTRRRHASSNMENKSIRKTNLGRLKPLKFVADAGKDDTIKYLQSLTPPQDVSDIHPSPPADVPTPELDENTAGEKYENTSRTIKGRQLRKALRDNSIYFSGDEVYKVPNLINSPLRILNFSCDDIEDESMDQSLVRRSSRLREKYIETVKLLQTPPQKASRKEKVLVADTPKCDYGLSRRKRQLAQLRGKISVKTS